MMATLKERLDAISEELKAAQTALSIAIDSGESNSIVNKAKARLNEARKAYELSAPQRSDTNPPVAVTATPSVPTPKIATATATPIIRTKATEDVPVEVDFASLTAEEQEVLGAIGEGAVAPSATPKTVKSRTPKYNPINGKLTGYEITYSDGTVEFEAANSGDDETDVTTTTYTAPDGTIFTNLDLYNAYIGKLKSDEKRQRGQSAYELLYEEFDRYGLAS